MERASFSLAIALTLRVLSILLYLLFVRPILRAQLALSRAENRLLDVGATHATVEVFVTRTVR